MFIVRYKREQGGRAGGGPLFSAHGGRGSRAEAGRKGEALGPRNIGASPLGGDTENP